MAENNKRFGRRAGIGSTAIALLTVAFYMVLCVCRKDPELMKIGRELFADYAVYVFGTAAFVIGGLSATDIFLKRKTNG